MTFFIQVVGRNPRPLSGKSPPQEAGKGKKDSGDWSKMFKWSKMVQIVKIGGQNVQDCSNWWSKWSRLFKLVKMVKIVQIDGQNGQDC